MNLIHDLDYLFSKNPVILINITWNLLKIVAAPIKLSVLSSLSSSTLNVYVNTSETDFKY